MSGRELENCMLAQRAEQSTELIFFVNAGDPSMAVTYQMLSVLARQGIVAVELCVPFPKSLTDGPLIRRSHQRALQTEAADLDAVLRLAKRARTELGLSIVLLADYAHTVKPFGMDEFLSRCVNANVSATLIHCLPTAWRSEYIKLSTERGIGRIMSFFAGSDDATRERAYQETEGYLYVVSRFGRTGNKVNFDQAVLDQLLAIRQETEKPLAVGFGVKTAADVDVLSRVGADAVIIGSAATAVVENNLATPQQIAVEFDRLITELRGKRYRSTVPVDQMTPVV